MTDTSRPYPHYSGLDQWLTRLSEREMPVLGNTVRELCTISADDAASARDLASVVLRDAAMTSGVLKLANSAYYNTGTHEISTISRAVVLLGFDAVRSIGMSLALIDTLLKPPARSRVVALLRQAVHAAAQAKNIALHRRDPAAEEIFIAALLLKLGDMAFWSFASDQEMAGLRDNEAMSDEEARLLEIETLGFSLRQLGAALAKTWSLGDLLSDALQPKPGPPSARSACVRLGHEVEAVVRRHGWDSPEAAAVMRRVAAHAGVPASNRAALIESSKRELAQAAEAFGIRVDAAAATDGRPVVAAKVREPDALLQLRVLRELSALLQKKPDIQVVLDMVMEGIFRGIGMDRAALAVLSPDRQAVKVKYALGEQQEKLKQGLSQNFDDGNAVVRKALAHRRPSRHGGPTLPPELSKRLSHEFLLGPLVIKGREIGLIYADRQPSGRALSEADFEAFCHFLDQTNLALEHLARR